MFWNRVKRNDPVFGSMLYMGDKVRYWEGKARFEPTGTDIEVFVDGASDDDLNQQHDFFEAVSRCWHEMSPAVTAKIQAEYGHRSGETLRLSSLSIPESPFSEDAEWEMSVLGEHSNEYTVQMRGTTPESVAWDT